jgi:hypothetical protein
MFSLAHCWDRILCEVAQLSRGLYEQVTQYLLSALTNWLRDGIVL